MKVGIIKPNVHGHEYIATCACGTVRIFKNLGWQERGRLVKDTVCEGCGNSFWVSLKHHEQRKVFPHLEALRVDRKGFKVKRTNLSVWHDEDYNVLYKSNMVRVLIYDVASKSFKLYKNGEDVKINNQSAYYTEEAIKPFFKGVDQPKFKKMVTHPDTEHLFDFAWNKLSTVRSGDSRFYKGLVRLREYPHMEILANAGIPNLDRFYRGSVANKYGSNPVEILGVPKFVIKYIRENANISTYDIGSIRNALKRVDGNRFKEVMEIVKDESTISELCRTLDTMIEIHDTYKYNNVKKLTLYLFRELRLTQGITSPSNGANLLRDYIRMSTKLGIEYEKYPRSLKKEHDITQMNYKVQESAIKKKDFERAIEAESYQNLKWNSRQEFSIIPPKEIDDIIKEGNELSHCVASYVDSVISGQCKILFLRKSKDIDSPHATVEVRGNNVRQARGYANRVLGRAEQEFLAEWAKKKELKLNYYY